VSDQRERALEIMRQMLPPEHVAAMTDPDPPAAFGSEIPALAYENIFVNLWGRPGLDARSRSILTLGILIALRATKEMASHFPAAVRNGVTIEELEEIVYHATGYAGFPAGATAREVAETSLREAGLI
jgi:4-carboxymuconolactone decarboxylase